MRIYSSFKDYYDGGMAYGMDAELVYLRYNAKCFLQDSPAQAEIKKVYSTIGGRYSRWFTSSTLVSTIGVAGKIYLMAMVNHNCMHRKLVCTESALITNSVTTSVSEQDKEYVNKLSTLEPIINDSLFIALGVPVFATYSYYEYEKRGYVNVIETNFSLKGTGLETRLDPYTAYQEISMYLGNQLVKRDNPPQITDSAVLARKHGHDPKTSFRKGKAVK